MKINLNNMEKTIEQVKEDKAEFELRVSCLIVEFEQTTGCKISSIAIVRSAYDFDTEIRLTVEL